MFDGIPLHFDAFPFKRIAPSWVTTPRHRLILSGMCGVLAPNNHLQQLNPHLSFDNKGALLTDGASA